MPTRFLDTLLAAPRPIVMEIKRRGANGQDLLRGRSLQEIVATYEAMGAPCLSVVTGRWFGGDLAMLREAASLTDLPILIKDFVASESHVARAAGEGAEAVLLTARLLPKAVLPRLIEVVLRHGLTPFVEVASLAELEVGSLGAACAIAVNNKDIATRERDPAALARSLALLPRLRATGTRCPISASGIVTPEAASMLVRAGYRGLLIGTGLLLTADLPAWLKAFDTALRPEQAA